MKHVPTVLLVMGLLLVFGFITYFSLDLFVNKGTKISFEPVKTSIQEDYVPDEQVQQALINIMKGSELYLVRDQEILNLNKKKINEILQQKKVLLKTNPKDPVLLFELGYYSFLNSYNAQALNYLEKSHNINPQKPDANLTRALVLFKMGNADKSITILNDLEKTFPDNADILLCKGIIYEKLKDVKRSRHYYSKVLGIDKRNVIAKKALVRLQ